MTGDPAAPAGPVAPPSTVLVTGAGGSGRTTVAAATALAACRDGRRVLLLTTEEAETPAAVLGLPLSPAATVANAEPVEGVPGLWAARTAPDEEFRTLVAALQRRGRTALELAGSAPLDDDEITALPGADALALLRALRAAHAGAGGRRWDTVVVDLPPAPQALRLLALPEQLRRQLGRLLPPEKQAARALRPLLGQLAGVPMPAPWLYGTVDRWQHELALAQDLLESPGTTVRLVAEPAAATVPPLHTARAALALYGLRLDAVIANRMLPTGSRDPWLAGLSGEQQSALKELRGTDTPPGGGSPVHELPHLGHAPRGPADLTELAALLPPPVDGATAPPVPAPVEDRLGEEGQLHWRIPLPGARREAVDLVRRGDELIVGVGPHRRILPLPSALRRCRVAGAALRDGELRVRFAPDPGLWPRNGDGRADDRDDPRGPGRDDD